MEARANDINILENYKAANPEEGFEIMFAHYSFFPKVIRKLEKKTQFKIKAEREYLRSHNRGELGVRVQTSNISSPTEDEAIANIEIEEAFKTGEIDSSILKGIDNAAQYEDAFRSAIERNVRIIVFSFVTSRSSITEVEVYSHERERRPENTDSRIMIVADEKLVMIADAGNARGNWSGTVSNNKLMKDVVREHIHNDIYMLKFRNIFGKEIYAKIQLNTNQETKGCQEIKK